MADTLLLDRTLWDVCVDAAGNIAVAEVPYAAAQDAASACRLFAGELWYESDRGIPYFRDVLGYQAPLSLLRTYLVDAAKSVPEVESARVFFEEISARRLAGQLQITTTAGITSTATF